MTIPPKKPIPRKTTVAVRPSAHAKALNQAQALYAISTARKALLEHDAALTRTVLKARRLGVTWDQIGNLLGISRQAAYQRFGRKKQ